METGTKPADIPRIKRDWRYWSWWIGALILLAPFVWLALHNMAASDDYYDYYLLQRFGPFEAVYHYYFNWSGRFVSHFLAFCLNPLQLGERVGPALTALLGIGLLAGLAYRVSIALNTLNSSPNSRLVRTVLLIGFWLCYLPFPSEIVYWFTGMIAYLPGLLGIAVWVGLSLQRLKTKMQKFGFVLLPLLVAGTNELNCLLMAYALGGRLLSGGPKLNPLYRWAILTFTLGALMELLSPGSRVRMTYFAETNQNPAGDWHFTLSNSIAMAWHVLRDWTRSTPILWVALLLAWVGNSGMTYPGKSGLDASRPTSNPLNSRVWLVWAVGLLLIPMLYFPFFWGTGSVHPPRRIDDVVFLVFTTWISIGTCMAMTHYGGRLLIPKVWIGPAAIILFWTATYNSRYRGALADRHLIPSFRKELTDRQKLTQQHQIKQPYKPLVLPPLKHIPYTLFFGDLSNDPNHWYNEGYARYHGVREVVVEKSSI